MESVFKEIKNRDAWSIIRGFVYQVDMTILNWINLKPNEILELEKGEDIDIITKDKENDEILRELEQIKHRDTLISLNDDYVIEILFNFCQHKNNNPSKRILFRFITNTNFGVERPALFLDGKAGIQAWLELSELPAIPIKDIRYNALKQHLLSKINGKIQNLSLLKTTEGKKKHDQWQIFYSYIKKDKNLINTIKDFKWNLNSDDKDEVCSKIKEQLIFLNLVPINFLVETVYSKLFLHVFKLLSVSGQKLLDIDLLEKQTSTAELLKKIDDKLMNSLSFLIHNIGSQVKRMEEDVKINSTQIQNLISEFESVRNPHSEFNFAIRNLSINRPSKIKDGSLRARKVNYITDLFKTYDWINFQGINGTGKSQLAVLVCDNFQYYSWIDLGSYNENSEKTTFIIKTFISIITKSSISSLLSVLFDNLITIIPNNSILVINDLPRIENNSSLKEFMISFSERIKGTGIKILTTSNFKIPGLLKQSLSSNLFYEYYDFDFTNEEIIEFCLKNGADEEIKQYINLIVGISYRNPRIINAIVQHLKNLKWGKDAGEVFEVLFCKEFSIEILQDAQLSIKKFINDESSRELLYRLSLIGWNIMMPEIKALCEIKKEILHPNEKIQDLVNIWIQEKENTFSVSPIIYDIGNNNLPQKTIYNVHRTYAKSLLLNKVIDQISATRIIVSFIKGKDFNSAGIVLLNMYKSTQTKDQVEILRNWGFIYYWATIDIPNEMDVFIRAYLRAEQIRIFNLIGKDSSILINRLEDYANEEGLSINESIIVRLLCLTSGRVDIDKFWKHFDFLMKNRKEVEEPLKDQIDAEMVSGLLWYPITQVYTQGEINKWIYYIDLFELDFKSDFFIEDISQDAITLLCSKIVNSKLNFETDHWKRIIDTLNYLIIEFHKRKLDVLEVIVLKEIIALEYSVFNNKAHAYSLTIKNLQKVSSIEAKYLLSENIGKLFFKDSEIEKSKKWLLTAIELNCYKQTNYIDTLIYGAASVSKENSSLALELCEKAINLAQKKENYSRLDNIQILCELAIAYWINKEHTKCFEVFETVVETLFDVKDSTNNSFWIRLFLLTGHALGYISAEVANNTLPKFTSDGVEYFVPYQGLFTFYNNDLSQIYKEQNESIIMVHLAIFADGINNITKAYQWSLRAFDLGRKYNNQKILMMISAACGQYSLINFKVEEAFESYLIFCAVNNHLSGTVIEKHDKLGEINIIELLSLKPSKKWDEAEDTTVLFAIIPLFIMILSEQIQYQNNKEEHTEMYKKLIQDYSLKASKRRMWEVILELSTRILANKISINELRNRSNTFGANQNRNLQMICILGIIYLSHDYEMRLSQIINIFPFLIKVNQISKSIIKFVLIPFVRSVCLDIHSNNYIGDKCDFETVKSQIESIKLNDSHAIQLILQPLIKEFNISIPDDRKLWLYDYIDIN